MRVSLCLIADVDNVRAGAGTIAHIARLPIRATVRMSNGVSLLAMAAVVSSDRAMAASIPGRTGS